MLYAIFFLLLIVFFPILSVVLGVGVVALVATYWWVILIIVALPVVIKVLDKPYQSSNADTKPNNPTPKSEIDSKELKSLSVNIRQSGGTWESLLKIGGLARFYWDSRLERG